jgi:hypothetical protein
MTTPSGLTNQRPNNIGTITTHGTKKRASKKLVCLFCFAAFIVMAMNLLGHTKLNSFDETRGGDAQAITPILWTYPTENHTLQKHKSTNHACDGYRGIYHIEKGDIGGAAGTVFFQFVIGQLIYAEMYNLKPWVHLNNLSYVIYDPIVHGRGPGVNFTMMGGANVTYIHRPNGHWRDSHPGPPGNEEGLVPTEFHFDGNGVWDDYFEPVSDFIPGDLSCRDKPLITMDLYLVTPGVHGFAPWAPRCWRYQYLPDYITKPHMPLQEWLEPQRDIAHKVLKKYIRFLPHIKEKAYKVNPSCSMANSCLGVHIRQSDKAAGRRQIQTDEFLPYVEAFVAAGGKWIYLATDSGRVLEEVRKEWPRYLQPKIRTMGDNVVRSNDEKAVFDIASHHRTNTEILIEILALSTCQFMIHGLSAVTETSVWINVDLHYTSVNLEDPDHLEPNDFGGLVKDVLQGGNATQIMLDRRTTDWWKKGARNVLSRQQTQEACKGVDGILHVAHVGTQAATGTAFFTSVLNQLIYAEQHHLKPWVHLSNESLYIYDNATHDLGPGVSIESTMGQMEISMMKNDKNPSLTYPGKPVPKATPLSNPRHFQGSGIWDDYFYPVSDFMPGDKSCNRMPILSMSSDQVTPGLNSWSPWSEKAWRYDDVPDDLWKPENMTLRDWLEPMRRNAHGIVKKYYQFLPFIEQRANEVNPSNSTTPPCLAVHIRNSDKNGVYRGKFTPNKFREYMMSFVKAGGQTIYVASDSHSKLEYLDQHFPPQLRRVIRTQGPYVVRSTKKWPIHFLEKHHRTNSEALVDILAMSKCQLMLHGNSAVSEAAIYLNLNLHNQSVNWEDKDRMSVQEFEQLSTKLLRAAGVSPPTVTKKVVARTPTKTEPASGVTERLRNVTIVRGSNRKCRKNAIVYLAQKRHSTYGRDSFGILMESLELMHKNYISLENHGDNADIIIFHTADFDEKDLDSFETRFGAEFRSLIRLVDLSGTPYWQRPSWHQNDDPSNWYAYPQFSEGYRRMMHWFAIDIWQFFADYNSKMGCDYKYIMRFDEDSFLRSPVRYDIFDFMETNGYYYGFRLCSYEMQVTQRIWKLWRKSNPTLAPIRDIDLGMCGVYNNFFVANLQFFQSPEVTKFLKFVDRQGMIYRRRLGDLMIHSMTIYSFAPPDKIHRFLDFTYEHSTVDKASGCVMWGGIQAGYDDPNADATLDTYFQKKVVQKGCQANRTITAAGGLSPTYSHLSQGLKDKIRLKSIMAGKVELLGKGILSG